VPLTASPRARRATGLALGVLVVLGVPAGAAGAQDAPGPSTTAAAPPASAPAGTTPPGATTEAPAGGAAAAAGRTWLVAVPVGCTVPNLPDVVFVGTLLDKGTPAGLPDTTENETARFRLDQPRAGSLEQFTYNGIVDVRYGADTKDLDKGEQYLVGASVDATTGALSSTVREAEPAFGGDDVIAAAQQDLKCPTLADPVRTLHTDGTPVDDSLLKPLLSSKGRLLRAILLPLMVVFGVVFALVTVRWLITGAWRGATSIARTSSQTREVRGAMRSRPNVNRDLEDADRGR
jgi:hypothetical protein